MRSGPMSGRKKRDINGLVSVEGETLRWSVKSEQAWGTSDGDIGLRLTLMRHDETLNRYGKHKPWRELVLQFPFEKPKHATRFPDKPRVDPERLARAVKLAMDAGFVAHSRGRPFELVLEEGDLS